MVLRLNRSYMVDYGDTVHICGGCRKMDAEWMDGQFQAFSQFLYVVKA